MQKKRKYTSAVAQCCLLILFIKQTYEKKIVQEDTSSLVAYVHEQLNSCETAFH